MKTLLNLCVLSIFSNYIKILAINYYFGKEVVELRGGTTLTTASTRSLLLCASLCFNDNRCVVYSYNVTQKLCRLHGNVASIPQYTTVPNGSEWRFYLKVCRQSSFYVSSDSGCIECPKLYICDGRVKYVCTSGYYCEGGVRLECPSGYYCNEGVKIECPKGHFCVKGSKSACPKGHYQDKTGQSVCIRCTETRHYMPDTGAVSCIACPQSYQEPIADRTQCTPCFKVEAGAEGKFDEVAWTGNLTEEDCKAKCKDYNCLICTWYNRHLDRRPDTCVIHSSTDITSWTYVENLNGHITYAFAFIKVGC